MPTDEKNKEKTISAEDLLKFNKFLVCRCPVVREDVFHGLTIEKDGGEMVCFQCRQKYDLVVLLNSRDVVERSLNELYKENKDKVDLSPPPKKHPKKRWNPRYLFQRGFKK